MKPSQLEIATRYLTVTTMSLGKYNNDIFITPECQYDLCLVEQHGVGACLKTDR